MLTYTWYLIFHKSETLQIFKNYLTEVEAKFEGKVKTLRTVCGREYLSDQFNKLRSQQGIVQQLTMPYMPQQNDMVEMCNRILLDMIWSMMAQVGILISYWGHMLLTVAYVLNRVPYKLVKAIPFELWKCGKHNLGHLHPWTLASYVLTFYPYGK